MGGSRIIAMAAAVVVAENKIFGLADVVNGDCFVRKSPEPSSLSQNAWLLGLVFPLEERAVLNAVPI